MGKNFVKILESFNNILSNSIDATGETVEEYKKQLTTVGTSIDTSIEDLKSKADEYYKGLASNLNTDELVKCSKELAINLSKLEAAYTTWYNACNKVIQSKFVTTTETIYNNLLAKEEKLTSAEKTTLKQMKKAKEEKEELETYFLQNISKFFSDNYDDSKSPDKSSTNYFVSQTKSCKNIIKEIKMDYEDFMDAYVGLISSTDTNDDYFIAESGKLNTEKLYKELEIDDIEQIEKGQIQIPFNSNKITLTTKDENTYTINSEDIKIDDLSKVSFMNKLYLYIGLYKLLEKEVYKYNSDCKVYNNLVVSQNNANSLAYKIGYIKDVYEFADVPMGYDSIKDYITVGNIWTKIYKKINWDIKESEATDFSNYLKEAVIDIIGLDLGELFKAKTETKKGLEEYIFKKVSGKYIINLDCLDQFKINGDFIKKDTYAKSVIKNTAPFNDKDSLYYLSNFSDSVNDNKWNEKYSLLTGKYISSNNFIKIEDANIKQNYKDLIKSSFGG
jgi:hypothetical protein